MSPLQTTVTIAQNVPDGALAGRLIRINDGQTKRILSNTGAVLFVDSPWGPLPTSIQLYEITDSAYRISTVPEDQTDGIVREPSQLITVNNDQGGMDTIHAGAGNDQVFGGAANDMIFGEDDDDVLVGDAGRIDRARDPLAPPELVVFNTGGPTPVVGSVLSRVQTIVSNIEGVDTIEGNSGDEIILGGESGDEITGGDGSHIVLGDHGFVDYAIDDDDFGNTSLVVDIDRVWSTNPAIGGSDTITTGDSADIIIGGANDANDEAIDAGDGDNFVIGDSGRITAAEENAPQFVGEPITRITLGLIETIAADHGGRDVITTGIGADIILGGAGGDQITANNGENFANPDRNNIILGDHGYLDYVHAERTPDGGPVGDTNSADIDRVWSTDTASGGSDTITTGVAADIIIGGTNDAGVDETITAGTGNNFVIGDNGRITAAAEDAPQFANQPITLGLVETTSSIDGGRDLITTGIGADIILGGAGGDQITANDGENAAVPALHDQNNIILGDHGYFDYVRAERCRTAFLLATRIPPT